MGTFISQLVGFVSLFVIARDIKCLIATEKVARGEYFEVWHRRVSNRNYPCANAGNGSEYYTKRDRSFASQHATDEYVKNNVYTRTRWEREVISVLVWGRFGYYE